VPQKPFLVQILEWFSTDPGKAVTAGFLGGVVRWAVLRHHWKEGVPALIVGSICAMWLSPLALPLIEASVGKIAPNGDLAGLSAFIVGLGGMSLAQIVIDALDRSKKGDDNGDGEN